MSEAPFAPLSVADVHAERLLGCATDSARLLLARALGRALRWADPLVGERDEAISAVRRLGADVFPPGPLRSIARAVIIGSEPPRGHEAEREIRAMGTIAVSLADPSSPELAAEIACASAREEVLLAAIEATRAARCADGGTIGALVPLMREVRRAIRGDAAPREEMRDAA